MTEHSTAPDRTGVAGDDALHPVVTIWEEYGAGADAIGRAVAQRLGLPFHQQAFSSEEIETEGGSPKDRSAEAQATELDDRIALSQVFAAMGGAYGGFDGLDIVTTQQEKRKLISDNNDIVRGFARQGGVIIGRNATVILASRPRTVHVLLTGDVETRVARAAEAAGISPRQAQERQKREDRVRADMSRSFYGWDPRSPERYDLVINTGRLPAVAAAEAIVHTVQARSS